MECVEKHLALVAKKTLECEKLLLAKTDVERFLRAKSRSNCAKHLGMRAG